MRCFGLTEPISDSSHRGMRATARKERGQRHLPQLGKIPQLGDSYIRIDTSLNMPRSRLIHAFGHVLGLGPPVANV